MNKLKHQVAFENTFYGEYDFIVDDNGRYISASTYQAYRGFVAGHNPVNKMLVEKARRLDAVIVKAEEVQTRKLAVLEEHKEGIFALASQCELKIAQEILEIAFGRK